MRVRVWLPELLHHLLQRASTTWPGGNSAGTPNRRRLPGFHQRLRHRPLTLPERHNVQSLARDPPFFVANRCNIAVGSAPVERMKMIGVRQLVSGKTSSSVHGRRSVNASPAQRRRTAAPTPPPSPRETSWSAPASRRAQLHLPLPGVPSRTGSPTRPGARAGGACRHVLGETLEGIPEVVLEEGDVAPDRVGDPIQRLGFIRGDVVSGVPRRKTFHSLDSMDSLARRMPCTAGTSTEACAPRRDRGRHSRT